jgi:hypothetical protein
MNRKVKSVPGKICVMFTILLLIVSSIALMPVQSVSAVLQDSNVVRIFGLVSKPLNLTYSQLTSFPMVSEVARLQCVVGIPDVTYNWTGIPLFYLLTLVETRPDAYKIVTRGSDGFSSDLVMDDALKPTTILALGANGTGLPEISGIKGLFRLVVPHKWGYKWVADVTEIEVVNSDYKGTYESSGWGDQADVPNPGAMPTLSPPIETNTLPYGNRTFEVDTFTNALVNAVDFDYFQMRLNINLSVPQNSAGFADFILQQSFLKGPYNVTLDGKPVDKIEADINQSSYLYVTIDQGNHTASIFGTEFFGHIPQIYVDYNNSAYTGQIITFNASQSVDYGKIVSFNWDFGDGTKGSGPVVSHAYSSEGSYQVTLNVTNGEGISNLVKLPLTVGTEEHIPFPFKVFLGIALGMIVIMFAALMISRKRNHPHKDDLTHSDAGN